MKAAPPLDPQAAFPDPMHLPADDDLPRQLGPAWPAVGRVLGNLRAAHPEVTSLWQYSPRAGWYQVRMLRKRRLLYLVPRCGDFRVSMILGGKAVAALLRGPQARQMRVVLKSARTYPEGTMLDFDRTSLDPDLLAALLEAKINPEPAAGRHPAPVPAP